MKHWGGRKSSEFRQMIVARDGGVCWHEGCLRPGVTVDHVPALSEGADWFDPATAFACCAHHNYSTGAALGNRQRAVARQAVPSREW